MRFSCSPPLCPWIVATLHPAPRTPGELRPQAGCRRWVAVPDMGTVGLYPSLGVVREVPEPQRSFSPGGDGGLGSSPPGGDERSAWLCNCSFQRALGALPFQMACWALQETVLPSNSFGVEKGTPLPSLGSRAEPGRSNKWTLEAGATEVGICCRKKKSQGGHLLQHPSPQELSPQFSHFLPLPSSWGQKATQGREFTLGPVCFWISL